MNRDKFYCTKCYYLSSLDTPPEICPICKSGSELFEEIPQNKKQTVPSYFEEHLEKKIDKINSLSGENTVSFGFVTDLHWASNCKHSAAILERVIDATEVRHVYIGGDIVCGSGVCPKSSLIRELREFGESFSIIETHLLRVLGNHDGAFSTFPIPEYYIESLTEEEINEVYFKTNAKYEARVFGGDGSYFYDDDEKAKTRFITLNTHKKTTEDKDERGIGVFRSFWNAGIMKEQFDWLCNALLTLPEGFTVVLSTHEPDFENIGFLTDVLSAFNRHDVFKGSFESKEKPHYNLSADLDFRGVTGSFAVWVTGHTHYDSVEMKNGVLVTTTVNDSMHNSASSPFHHEKGTVTEQAIDVFTINKSKRKIYVTRIGAGYDREFTY